MRRLIYLLATASALALVGATAANAQTLVLGGNFSGTFFATSSTTLALTTAPGTSYDAVQQQDKLWNNFSFAAGDLVQFTFTNVGGVDHHIITISDPNFASAGGATVGYEISVIQPSNLVLTSTDSALVQATGTASLTETLTPTSTPAGINFIQTGPGTINSGNTSAAFIPSATSVFVTDLVAPVGGGSTVGSVQNTFIESAVPGPIPGAGLGGMIALLGLGLLGRARGLLAR